MSELTFDKPGPGTWEFDRTHQQSPAPRLFQPALIRAVPAGSRRGFAAVGALLDCLEMQFVHGWIYMAPRPLGAPPDATGMPPRFVFKALLALHPALRRRVKAARTAWAERPWLAYAQHYLEAFAPEQERALQAAQARDPVTLDDDALADQILVLEQLLERVFAEHFALAGHTTPAVGQLLALADAHDVLDPTEVARLLGGTSEATRRPQELLANLGEALRHADAADAVLRATTAEQAMAAIRDAGPAAAEALDAWLDEFGWQAMGVDDVGGRPLLAQPDTLLALLQGSARGTTAPPPVDQDALLHELRDRLPEAARPELDRAAHEARQALAPRERSCQLIFRSFGLLWRAAMERGRRGVAAGQMDLAEHALCCTPAELAGSEPLPSAQELRDRAAAHDRAALARPPSLLGPAGAPPPAAWLPSGAREIATAVGAYLARFDAPADLAPDAASLTGLPVSPGVVEGRAYVLAGGRDASGVRAGDVLVALSTSASLNNVLAQAGGLVTEYGGLISHAAIVSRELGFPGIVGCVDATTAIPHGALVRVDGSAGRVEVLAAVAPEPEGPAPTEVATAPAVAPASPGHWRPLAEAEDGARFGGKAAHLARAVAAAQPVPAGLALDVDLVEGIAAGESVALTRLQAAFATLRLPIAARSSAPGEDGAGASFAGLHETVLGLRSLEEVAAAIVRIRDSAHGPAALAYRRRLGIEGRPAMGVILQELVPAEVAGVRFGRDPVTGEHVQVVEAAPGLGVAVVDGRVRPDRFRLDPEGRPLDQQVGFKPVRLDVDETGLVERNATHAQAPCLDAPLLHAVHELGQRCDALFGGPQDIEWAVVDGQVWLLQSRPVTTGGAS